MPNIKAKLRLFVFGKLADFLFKSGTPAPKRTPLPPSTNLTRALDLASRLVAMDHGATRAENKPSLREMRPVFLNRTRGGETSPSNWYIRNYDNDEGFAIITDADVTNPVVAFSSEGNIPQNGENTNPGLNMYFEIIKDYGTDLCDGGAIPWRGETKPDTIIWTGGDTGKEPFPNPGPDLPTEVWVRGPYLKYNVTLWDQRYPYNYFCPKQFDVDWGCDQHTVVGCTAVALGMLMSHFKHPAIYEEAAINWNEILDYTTSKPVCLDLFRLLRNLGNQCNLDITYGLSSSPAKTHRIAPTLSNFGYLTSNWQSFSENQLRYILDAAQPALIIGTSKKTGSGHCWIIDGLLRVDLICFASDNESRFQNYYRNIMGWRGTGNGLYKMPNNVDIYGEDNNKEKFCIDSYINLQLLNRITIR